MDSICGYAHLCSKAIAEAIGKSRRAIVVDTRRIYPAEEGFGNHGVFRDDALRVPRAVAVDVVDRFLDGSNCLDSHSVTQEFGIKVIFLHRLGKGCRQMGQTCRVCLVMHIVLSFQCCCKLGQERLHHIFMYQKCLHRVAGRTVVCLGVDDDFHGFLQVCLAVDINSTDSVCMAHNRNAGGILDRLDQLVGTSWNDQVDVLVLL
mmetsp:Transcript_50059/g.104184  ORF Transcript_50059/g.104184 Transcript_50059/m.104184 type:complete len:204 (-) Transcript_50059:645-1256(-)